MAAITTGNTSLKGKIASNKIKFKFLTWYKTDLGLTKTKTRISPHLSLLTAHRRERKLLVSKCRWSWQVWDRIIISVILAPRDGRRAYWEMVANYIPPMSNLLWHLQLKECLLNRHLWVVHQVYAHYFYRPVGPLLWQSVSEGVLRWGDVMYLCHLLSWHRYIYSIQLIWTDPVE